MIPGIDDGAPDLQTSLQMVRMSVAEGVKAIACTPHILPGVYDNSGPDIRRRVEALQSEFDAAGIDCRLVVGCEAHIAPDLVSKLKSGLVPTINNSRYVLVEPPHHFVPPNVDRLFFDLLAAGYVPILTHPERMTWADHDDGLLNRLIQAGTWMQVTAGSILGGFGPKAKHRAERMLQEGWVHIVASDAHNAAQRSPAMGQAFRALCDLVGVEEAENLVRVRPEAILEDRAPGSAPPVSYRESIPNNKKEGTSFRRATRALSWGT
jgi:protein-tyrosine phosphatase